MLLQTSRRLPPAIRQAHQGVTRAVTQGYWLLCVLGCVSCVLYAYYTQYAYYTHTHPQNLRIG